VGAVAAGTVAAGAVAAWEGECMQEAWAEGGGMAVEAPTLAAEARTSAA